MSSWLQMLGIGSGETPVTTITDADVLAAEEARRKRLMVPAAKVAAPSDYVEALGSADTPPTGADDGFGRSSRASLNEYLDSPDYRQYLATLEKNQQDAIVNQKLGVESAQRNVDQFGKLPVQYDLSPLMNLSDSWFGSNLQKGYKAPSSAQELIGARGQLEAALAKNRMGVTEAEKDRLQQNLTNRQKTAQLLVEATNADLKRKELGMQAKDRDAYKKDQQELAITRAFDKDYGDKLNGLSQLRYSLTGLQDVVNKYGGKTPLPTDPDYGEFSSKLAEALVGYNKYFAGLGALSGPDLGIITSGVGLSQTAALNWAKQNILGQNAKVPLTSLINSVDTSVGTLKNDTKLYQKRIPDRTNAAFGNYDAAKVSKVKQAPKISAEDAAALMEAIK
jgi:hypothetical protein